jgi:hypothetical protein
LTTLVNKEITCQDDCKKLQSDLDAAARWEADWLMAFHTDKCTVLTITQKKTPFKHDYILHNHILEPVTSAKYLGVTLQSNLKWNTHITISLQMEINPLQLHQGQIVVSCSRPDMLFLYK